jgi:1-acyl-sn-glycerol-3-phosphate acyltransferase
MSLMVATIGVAALLAGIVYPSRRLIASASLLWARGILLFSGVHLTIEGRQHIEDGVPRFYMGNHQSALDIPILIVALRGDVRFMAKDGLFRIPIFGWVLRRYGYAPVNRSRARTTLRSLDQMIGRIRRQPISFAVFPEGTRSRDGALLPFRRGTMKIGQRSGLPIAVFTIDGSMDVHHRDRFAATPGPVRLTFSEPIPAEEVAGMTPTELHDRVVATISRQLGGTGKNELRDEAACVAAKSA